MHAECGDKIETSCFDSRHQNSDIIGVQKISKSIVIQKECTVELLDKLSDSEIEFPKEKEMIESKVS